MHWPHAPMHRLSEIGAYIITAGTFQKAHLFRPETHLSLLQDNIILLADRYDWKLQAWAIFSNHYHLIAIHPQGLENLARFLGHLHTATATAINKLDSTPGRKVWSQYWDTHLTFEKSYLARLNYVHNNPVKHGLAENAIHYKWCSAAWFERNAEKSFYLTVNAMKTDRVNVIDDF